MFHQSKLFRRDVFGPLMAVILVFLVLFLFGELARSNAQTVTITRLDGSTLVIPPTIGGTRAAPMPVDVNLVAWSFPGGFVLANPGPNVWESNAGTRYEFASLTSDVGIEIKPTDPKRGYPNHCFVGGEWWPFIRADAIPLPPSPADTQAVLALLGWRYDLSLLSKYPRLDHLVKLFGDGNVATNAPIGQRDLGWVMRNKKLRMGGDDLVGAYESACTFGGDGFDNWHYDQLAFIALNWMRGRSDVDWMLGVRMAFAQACWGMYHTGNSWSGFFAYEKGYGIIGGHPAPNATGQIPDWGKQWLAPLVLWWLLTERHPLLGAAIEDHLALLRRTNPKWWGGDWGERRPARYLDSLRVAYLLTGDDVYRQKAVTAVAHIWTQIDGPTGLWVNKGSPPTTSPWMHGELISELIGWEQLGVTGPPGALRAAYNRTMASGTFHTANGRPGVWYRFFGPEKRRESPALNGFMIPAIRYFEPARATTWMDATFGPMLAASWSQVDQGIVAPIQDVGIEYSPLGSAAKKVFLEVFYGIRR